MAGYEVVRAASVTQEDHAKAVQNLVDLGLVEICEEGGEVLHVLSPYAIKHLPAYFQAQRDLRVAERRLALLGTRARFPNGLVHYAYLGVFASIVLGVLFRLIAW